MYNAEQTSHTADLRYIITADSIDEIFEAGLNCMGNLLKENFCKGEKSWPVQHQIRTDASDITVLFIDFLSDALTKSCNEKVIYCRLKIHSLSENHIEAEVFGEKTDFFNEDIKAVTYHEAQIHKNKSGKWQTNLIFDI